MYGPPLDCKGRLLGAEVQSAQMYPAFIGGYSPGRIGRPNRRYDHFCLVDLKEACKAAAPRAADASMPRENAERVVEGARRLSPYLGQRMLPTKFLNRSVVVRELLPQDLKIEMDQLTCDEAVKSARFLAGVVGRAHARQLDKVTQDKWRSELRRCRSKNLDAPSWLWASVVELVASHEKAYLEHCIKYALGRN